MQVTPACSTAGQIYVNLTSFSGATISSGGSTVRCANASTVANSLGVANTSYVLVMSSTAASVVTFQMAHATSSATPATFNFFNVTVTGLS